MSKFEFHYCVNSKAVEHHEDAEGDIWQPTHKVTPKGRTSSSVWGGNVRFRSKGRSSGIHVSFWDRWYSDLKIKDCKPLCPLAMVEWAKPSHPHSPEQWSPSPPTCLSPCLCSRLSWLQAIIQSQPKLLPRASVSFPPTVRQWKTLPNASTFLWSKLTSSEFRTHTAELRPLSQALLPLKSCLEQTPFCQIWSAGLLYNFWLVYSVIFF